jgi:transposase-like protein
MTTQERREQMFQLVTNWQQSGISQKAFAEAHDIKLFTFRYWIQKHREQHESSGSFLQLDSHLGSSGITIRYPNGTELQLPANTTLGTIKGLLSL